MIRRALALALVVTWVLPSSTSGQTPPPADPADVSSPDAILEAVYDVISGPAGEARDWDRFRSLFIPEARLIPSGPAAAGGFGYQVQTPAQFAAAAGPQFQQTGFFEREIHRTTERFGSVLHAFSTYESLRAADAEPFARGINSFQLHWDGERWWIVTIYWFAETPDFPIPEEYLPGGEQGTVKE